MTSMATQAEKKPRLVLIAMDGSKHSDYCFEWYVDHFYRDTDEVILLFVTDAAPIPATTLLSGNVAMVQDKIHEFEEFCKGRHKHIEDLAKSRNIKHKFERLEGHPGETIVKAAHDHKADFVIVGSRGHGVIRRTILGSISGYVLHHSHVPVLICKHEDERHRLRHHSHSESKDSKH